jgi:exosortase
MKYVPAWIIGLSYAPLALVHLRNLAMDERYQHFPLVLAAVGWLLWMRWSKRGDEQSRTARVLGVVLLLASAVCAVGSTVLLSPWLAFVGACLLFAVFLLDWQGRDAVRLLPVGLLLLLLLPLPMRLDDALVVKLQDVSSRWASILLDFFGVLHLLSGHIIEVPGKRFLVEEACSGVRSLFAMIALSAIFAVHERRPLVHAVLLIASSLFWSTACNVLRIAAVVVAQLMLHVDLAHGWMHDLLGVMVFGLGIYTLFCTDRVLLFLFESAAGRRRRPRENSAPQASQNAAAPFRLTASWPVAAVVLLIVGLPSAAVAAIELMQFTNFQSEASQFALQLREDSLPEQFGDWKRVDYQEGTQNSDPTHGAKWSAWTYRRGDLNVLVSLDYPFFSWHNLTVCYEGSGWKVDSWQVRRLSEDVDLEFIAFAIEKPATEPGRVLFNLFDSSGSLLPAPKHKDPAFEDWLTGIKLRFARKTHQLGFGRPNYQLQVVAFGPPEQLDAASSDLEMLFVDCFQRLVSSVK